MVFRNPIDEVKRGKQLAKAIATDRRFIERFNKVKQDENGRKTKYLISYLHCEGLTTSEYPLNLLSLDACLYFLKCKHGINMEDINWGSETVQYYERNVV